MREEMIIAYACDSSYLPYLKISMESVKRYNKTARFVVLTDKLFELDGAEVYTFVPDSDRFYFKDGDRVGNGVYYKLYLPNLPYKKVLYLDSDVACQRPLDSLWREKCEFICATESHKFGKKQAKELGVSKYANTGVMLMNLDALRKEGFTKRCLDRITDKPKQHDETVINLEFNDRIRFIDKKFNYCKNRVYAKPIPESDAYLLHYIGDQKEDFLKRDNFSGLGELKRLLKGKNVAIVGNSSKILENPKGGEIDEHDIVIRFNKGFPSSRVGYKTDIVFLACTLGPKEIGKYAGAYLVKRSKLCQNLCDFKISRMDRIQLAQVPNDTQILRGKDNSQASTGFIAINFALSCDCESIDLYGFDFFENPTYYNPVGYQTLHNGEEEKEKILEYVECGLVNLK